MSDACLVCSKEIETLGCGLKESELIKLRTFSTSVTIKKKDLFILEGDPQDYYYQIFSGVAATYNYLPGGKRIITEILFAGDFIGPQPKNTYPFSAEALQTVFVCRFERKKMDHLISTSPNLKDKINMFQQNALNKARTHLLNISHKAPLERVASFLLFICSNIERTGKNFIIPMGRQEIGDYLGLTSETVSRTMTDLSAQGIIAMETPSLLTICKATKLYEMVCGDQAACPYEFGKFASNLEG